MTLGILLCKSCGGTIARLFKRSPRSPVKIATGLDCPRCVLAVRIDERAPHDVSL